MLSRTDLVVGGVALVVILGVAAYARRKVADAVAGLPAGSLNPASPNNLAYRGANAVGAAVTGNREYSLGADVYENGIFRSPNPVAFVLDSLYAVSPVGLVARMFGPRDDAGASREAPAVEPAVIYTPFNVGA